MQSVGGATGPGDIAEGRPTFQSRDSSYSSVVAPFQVLRSPFQPWGPTPFMLCFGCFHRRMRWDDSVHPVLRDCSTVTVSAAIRRSSPSAPIGAPELSCGVYPAVPIHLSHPSPEGAQGRSPAKVHPCAPSGLEEVIRGAFCGVNPAAKSLRRSATDNALRCNGATVSILQTLTHPVHKALEHYTSHPETRKAGLAKPGLSPEHVCALIK